MFFFLILSILAWNICTICKVKNTLSQKTQFGLPAPLKVPGLQMGLTVCKYGVLCSQCQLNRFWPNKKQFWLCKQIHVQQAHIVKSPWQSNWYQPPPGFCTQSVQIRRNFFWFFFQRHFSPDLHKITILLDILDVSPNIYVEKFVPEFPGNKPWTILRKIGKKGRYFVIAVVRSYFKFFWWVLIRKWWTEKRRMSVRRKRLKYTRPWAVLLEGLFTGKLQYNTTHNHAQLFNFFIRWLFIRKPSWFTDGLLRHISRHSVLLISESIEE